MKNKRFKYAPFMAQTEFSDDIRRFVFYLQDE